MWNPWIYAPMTLLAYSIHVPPLVQYVAPFLGTNRNRIAMEHGLSHGAPGLDEQTSQKTRTNS